MKMIFLPSLLLLSSIFYGSLAQSSNNVVPGSSIVAGTDRSWRSPSGDFAFGFHRLENGLYLLGIWFDRIPEKTLVWSANRDNPAPPNSAVEFNKSGQFILSFPDGTIQLIYTQSANSASMENDGNFVLKDSNSLVLWQSFNSPTDTLLLGQVLRAEAKLFSAKSLSNYSTGNFMLQMQIDGNLVLSNYKFSNIGYWYTSESNEMFPNSVLVFDNSTGLMCLLTGTDSNGRILKNLTINPPTPIEEFYHRATIDVHGDFRQYVYRKRSGNGWASVWRAMEEPCNVNTVCGLNGLCNSPNNETLICDCLPGFVHLDPSDAWKGCRSETPVNYCAEESAKNFIVQVIDDTVLDFSTEPFADLARTDNVDLAGCKEAVMKDCYAMAAVLDGSMCHKKRTPLMNARSTSTTKGMKTLIKVPLQIRSNNSAVSHYRKFLEIGNIVTGVLAFCFGVFVLFYHPSARKLVRRKQFSRASAIGINFREFTFQELIDATNGFNKILGTGSSGKVFRGNLHTNDADVEIAVKVLDKMTERSEKEFVTELRIIGRTYHKNLVRLLGYCIENEKQLHLVYELMPNGTLSRYLFGGGETLNWIQRVEIAVGIARGLAYLHGECETQIIHCDVKPQNVLLDANFKAKISDFGLSKLLNKDQTRTKTEARGTIGYMAPEWLKGAPVTAKVDIYSYGVMLLEIICCRRHVELERVEEETEDDELILSKWVLSCAAAGTLEAVVGDKPEVLSDFERFERMAIVGLWCIHPDASLRPTMKKVTQMLDGTMEVGIPPLLLQSSDIFVN